MNLVDLVLLLVIGLSVLVGWYKGFILGTLNLITWAGSLLMGFFFYPYPAVLLQKYFPGLDAWNAPVAFLLTVIIARLLLSLVANQLLRLTPDTAHKSGFNKFLGIVPGTVNGIINAIVVAALLMVVPLFNGLSDTTRDSRLANTLIKPAEWVQGKIAPVFDEAVKKTAPTKTLKPKPDETVKLPYKVTNAKVRPDLEAQMLVLVNEERAKEGLKPLKTDPEMAVVARAHSEDMFAKSYFAHINLEGKTPFDRMKAKKVRFLSAGENLALAQTLPLAHKGLMNSPGHRANILQPSFGRLGIGILDGGIYGLMITQNFRN